MLSANELEAIPEGVMRMFRELELSTMSEIVERISYNLDITSLTDWQINRMYQLGVGKEVIKRDIQRTLGLSSSAIDKIYKNTLAEEYTRFKPIYQKLGESFIPYKQNKPLQQLVSGIKSQTKGELKNITQSMGFSVKNASGKRQFLPIADYYQKTLDNAAMQILTGVSDYNTVLKKTVREMTNSGLRTVDYASGYTNRVDVAARRAIMTGYSQVVGEINKENAEKLDTDLYEVSFHSGARPSHQEWEGGVYTMDELIEICGYGEVDGLMGANCYHDFTPFIEGVSERTYTDEELEQMKAEENEPVEYNGKEYNAYEAQQRQRALETNLRAKREEISLLEKGGASADDINAAKAKYHAVSDEYSKFSKTMGLPQQRERINISPHGGVDVSFGNSAKTAEKAVEKSAKSGIIEAAGNNNLRNKSLEQSIHRCINAEKPIFAEGSLRKNAQYITPIQGIYDIVAHGMPDSMFVYDEKITPQILANILNARKDYHSGTQIRLISCNTGRTDANGDCFAQTLSDLLEVKVSAPNNLIWVFPDGKIKIGSKVITTDGKMIDFYPRSDKK